MRRIQRLFEPPETSCPRCRATQLAWTRFLRGGPWKLLAIRLVASLTPRLVRLPLRCKRCHNNFEYLFVAERTVVGYHGCSRSFAASLIQQRHAESWRFSHNDYDWLGEGIYFWEHAPARAWQWARDRHGDAAAVVAAEIRLGRCLDLADTAFTDLLRQAYQDTVLLYEQLQRSLPTNEGRGLKLRRLDRIILDRLTKATDRPQGVYSQTIRCPFEEGEAIYPGGLIRSQSHVQIAVRDRGCIRWPIYPVPPEGN